MMPKTAYCEYADEGLSGLAINVKDLKIKAKMQSLLSINSDCAADAALPSTLRHPAPVSAWQEPPNRHPKNLASLVRGVSPSKSLKKALSLNPWA
jgi:hypothetical protein